MSTPIEIGPQYAGDGPFRARMRFHQSWWRAEVLNAPHGIGPTASGKPLGSCLDQDSAEAGRNFLTTDIFGVAQARIAQGSGVERFRCLHNLLSSQPMCFNLFGPMVRDKALATTLLGAVVPGGVSQVTDVRVEYAPAPAGEYVGDRSAFDAFVEYLDGDGATCFIGVETKLTEPFSPHQYRKDSSPRYQELTDAHDSPWTLAGQSTVDAGTSNQLWRNHMLVEAVRKHPSAPHGTRGWLAVAHHPGDTECTAALASYRSLLHDPDGCLLDWRLGHLVDAWRPLVAGDNATWLARFEARYVDLSGSEAMWTQRTAK